MSYADPFWITVAFFGAVLMVLPFAGWSIWMTLYEPDTRSTKVPTVLVILSVLLGGALMMIGATLASPSMQ